MKSIIIISILLISCNESSDCWEEYEVIKEKTNRLHNMEYITLSEKLKAIRMWQDSLKYYEIKMSNGCKNIEPHAELMYKLGRVVFKNTDFIRTHEKINE